MRAGPVQQRALHPPDDIFRVVPGLGREDALGSHVGTEHVLEQFVQPAPVDGALAAVPEQLTCR